MKIAYCIHSLRRLGGKERELVSKANCLAADYGYEVYIITALQKGLPPSFSLEPSVRLVDIGRNDKFQRRSYARELERVLCSIRPYVTVSLCGDELFILPSMRDGSRKLAEFHFSHEKYYQKYGRNLYSVIRTRRLERAVDAMDAFVVLTKADAVLWRPHVRNVRQIYNAAPPVRDPLPSLEEKVFVSVGRLAPEKNYRDLILAWKTVSLKHPDWTLKIYGDGPQRKYLENLVRTNGLSSSVLLMGATGNVGQALTGASGFVLTSLREGFPLALLEASSCGLPLVSYDCRFGPSEIIDDGVNGFLVPCGDREALSERICRLAGDIALRKEMGAASAARAAQFDKKTVMSAWVAIFQRLAGGE